MKHFDDPNEEQLDESVGGGGQGGDPDDND